MAFDFTYPTLSAIYDSTENDTNFSDVRTKFNGNIVNADISAGAAITMNKLSASYQEVWVELNHLALIYGAAWPAVAVNPLLPTKAEILAFVPIPCPVGSTDWTAVEWAWMANDCPAAAAAFDVRYGEYDGAGQFQSRGIVIANVSMAGPGADLGAQGRGAVSVTISVGTGAGKTQGLVLLSAGTGAGTHLDDVVGPNSSFLKVAVALRRQIQP